VPFEGGKQVPVPVERGTIKEEHVPVEGGKKEPVPVRGGKKEPVSVEGGKEEPVPVEGR
jgi:hypothetical protein